MTRDIFRLAYDVHMLAGESDTAEAMLYGEIIQDCPSAWKWSEEDKSAADFDKEIKGVKRNGAKKLLLRINSPGGMCTESIAMRSILANAGFDEINILIEGMCASAATDIATLPGAHVAIAEGSEYMIHNPQCQAEGTAADLERTASRMRNIEQMSRAFYAKRSGQNEEQIKAWMDAETWFTAEQAVQYGFADQVIEAGSQAVACASMREMATMRGLYKAVPEQIAVRKEAQNDLQNDGSNESPVAGNSTVIDHEEETQTMEIKDITQEQLLAENPALLEKIQQAALTQERQRQEDIDAITPPVAEYQRMAEDAKRNGTPFTEYQRSLVAAQRQKGTSYMTARQQETAAAQQVTGGHVENQKTEEDEIKQNAKDIAAYASAYRGSTDGSMY